MAFTAAVLAAILVASASAVNSTSRVPSNQVVTVDDVDVYSQSAGDELLNVCGQFPSSTVESKSMPVIKVCGTQTKVTVFLRNRCKDYHEYNQDIGTCDTSADSTSCVTKSPATDPWMFTAQSYMITQCATGNV